MTWQEYNGSFSSNPGIYYSRWNGDTWSTPSNISENTGYADGASITTDSSRTVHFVWNDDSSSGGLPKALYRTRTEAGSLSTTETLPVPSGMTVTRNAGIAIDGSGNPHAIYTSMLDPQASLFWTTKTGGSWSVPSLISKDTSNNDLTRTQFSQIKADASGNLHVVYWDLVQGIFYRKYSGGSWSIPVSIVPPGSL